MSRELAPNDPISLVRDATNLSTSVFGQIRRAMTREYRTRKGEFEASGQLPYSKSSIDRVKFVQGEKPVLQLVSQKEVARFWDYHDLQPTGDEVEDLVDLLGRQFEKTSLDEPVILDPTDVVVFDRDNGTSELVMGVSEQFLTEANIIKSMIANYHGVDPDADDAWGESETGLLLLRSVNKQFAHGVLQCAARALLSDSVDVSNGVQLDFVDIA